MAATLWIDVEDLFEYALHNSRPSGIQRVSFQLYRALQSEYGGTGLVRFVRHDTARGSYYAVTWHDVATAFDRLATGEQSRSMRRDAAPAFDRQRRSLRNLVHRLSPALRSSLIDALKLQGRAFRAWWLLATTAARGARSTIRRVTFERHGPVNDDFAHRVSRGDCVLMLGAPWSHPDYARFIHAQRERHGLRCVLLLHDLAALHYPEWFGQGLARTFRAWLDGMLPLCDAVFAVSQATAADAMAYARNLGVSLPGPVMPLPMGTTLSDHILAAAPFRAERLPTPGSYVLFVSTIEARKNHMLLFRIWRRMLDEMPYDKVPMLVFAGRVGWLVEDLMQQIINTDYLFGRLVLIEDASDAELASLYRGCLFTVYPSFFEGWGLPVTESLLFGKPCLISDRTSLPEAGGDLARYIDPDDLHGSYAALRLILEDRAQLAQWEVRIQREFEPVPWSATIRALVAGLGHPLAGEPAVRPSAATPAAATSPA